MGGKPSSPKPAKSDMEWKMSMIGDTDIAISTLGWHLHHRAQVNLDYPPGIHDHYKVSAALPSSLTFPGDRLDFILFPSIGAEQFKSLKTLMYTGSKVALAIYSPHKPESLTALKDNHIPHFQETCPHSPIIVLSQMANLRSFPSSRDSITAEQGREFAKSIGASGFFEVDFTSAYSSHTDRMLQTIALLAVCWERDNSKKHKLGPDDWYSHMLSSFPDDFPATLAE